MAPSPSPPKSKAGFAARLTAKAGPLPVWAWAALILGAYLLYSHLHPASAAATTSTAATPDTSGASDAQAPASGGGSAIDNSSGDLLQALGESTSSLDALTSQLLYTTAQPASMGDAPPAGSAVIGPATGQAPASQPSTPPTAPEKTGAPPAAHPTQTQTGSLQWFGQTFTTQAGFNAAAKAHGSSATQEFSNHPAAKAIYSTLK